jgi:lysozyme family protein
MSAFDQAFAIVVGHEGGFTDNSQDPGNWTGGAVGKGVCRGTKFGISAAAYPSISIADLTLADAQSIYRRDYWIPIGGDALAPPLALLAFDAAVNNGVCRSKAWLDVAEKRGGTGAAICAEFLAQRINFMAGLSTWRVFGLGWSRRLAALPYQSVTLTSA